MQQMLTIFLRTISPQLEYSNIRIPEALLDLYFECVIIDVGAKAGGRKNHPISILAKCIMHARALT
jgi:hypothetical protein